MTGFSFLTQIPLWIFGLSTLMILLGSLEFGFFLGRIDKGRQDGAAQLTTLQAATLGLLALVLSFTYSYVSARMDMRKLAVIHEANAIGTAYLRAGYIRDPQGAQIRSLLTDYVQIRVLTRESTDTPDKVRDLVSRSEQLHDQIWSAVEEIMAADAGPKEVSLVTAINEIIDLHTERLTVSLDRLPGIVMVMLLVIAAMGMFLTGCNAEIGGMRNRGIPMALACVLTLLILVIADLDRALSGFVQIDQSPYVSLIQSMSR
ncbi:MAG: hypothetical protein R2940_01035 [Syntrophotaleaceae bacterium]